MLTPMERALLEEALALPEAHDAMGCPAPRLYPAIAALRQAEPDSIVADDFGRDWSCRECCPMFVIHYMAEEFLKEDK